MEAAQLSPDGWIERMFAAIKAAENQPFVWGTHDCCTFAADVVQAMRGRDPMRELRGCYRDRRSAARLVRELGGLEVALASRLGPEVRLGCAGRGDVVLSDSGAVGIVTGSVAAFPCTELGVVYLHRRHWRRAWRCPA